VFILELETTESLNSSLIGIWD